MVQSSPIGNSFLEYLVNTDVSTRYEYQTSFSDADILLTNFYDRYGFTNQYSYSSLLGSVTNGYDQDFNQFPINELTGSISQNSDNASNTTLELYFYNKRGELIQKVRSIPNRGYSTTAIGYDFKGKPITSSLVHDGAIAIYKKYSYDLYGRMKKIEHKLNSSANYRTIAQYAYDDLGRMKQRRLGGMEYNLNYEYNIKNWLTSINKSFVETQNNDDYFGLELFYEQGFDQNYRNGKIAGIKWRNKGTGGDQRAYGYLYDQQDRLIFADYNQKSASNPTSWLKTEKDFTMSNVSYDENGNLLSMAHKATNNVGNIFILDDLNYQYQSNSNFLSSVTESASSSSADPSVHDGLADFRDVNSSGNPDYSYDASGNLQSDLNKGITTIQSNWFGINKPLHIEFSNGNTIDYTYDASGNLQKKQIFQALRRQTTVLEYLDEVVYKNGDIDQITHDEGRIRIDHSNNSYHYDYFIKDHLENVRSIITEEESYTWGNAPAISGLNQPNNSANASNLNNLAFQLNSIDSTSGQNLASEPVLYLATSEIIYDSLEEQLFDHISDTRSPRIMSNDTNNQFAARMNAAEGKIIGPGILLKVMGGDQIQLGAEGFYFGNNPPSNQIPIADLLMNVVTALSGPTGVGEGALTATQAANLNSSTLAITFTQIQNNNQDTNSPAAYLNYLVFDENMQILPDVSGALQFTQANAWQSQSPGVFSIPQNGYLYAFTSNNSTMSVRTDNLYVMHYQGVLLEEFHYYPFGLVFEPVRRTDILPKSSDYKYNEQHIEQNEFEDAAGNSYGVDWYDFDYRTYDPQIGRWWQHDPMLQYANPYLAMGNNPALLTDPSGLWSGDGDESDDPIKFLSKQSNNRQSVTYWQVGDKVLGFGNLDEAVATDTRPWFEYGNPFRVQSDGPGGSMDGIFLGLTFKNIFDPQRPRTQTRTQYRILDAVNYLTEHAYPEYDRLTCGKCAKAVRLAIEEGGIKTNDRNANPKDPKSQYYAKNWGPYLSKKGFSTIEKLGYSPTQGDIRVWEAYSGQKSNAGHIDMFNGSKWVSDFIQKDPDWPGSHYRDNNTNFEIFRWDTEE